MKFKVEATELYKLLNRVKPLTVGSRFSAMAAGDRSIGTNDVALLEARGKTVLEATGTSDAVSWLKVKGKGEVEEPGQILIPILKLMRVLKAFQGEVLEFSTFTKQVDMSGYREPKKMVDCDRLLVLLVGDSKTFVRMPLGTAANFVKMPSPDFTGGQTYSCPLKALEEVSWAASTDESRSATLMQMCIGDGWIAGTDSYRLHAVELPGLADTPTIMFPARFVKVLDAEGIKQVDLTAEKADLWGFVKVETDVFTLVTRQPGVDFPNWKSLVPKDSKHSLKCVGEGFFDILMRFRHVIEGMAVNRWDDNTLAFDNDGAEVVMRYKNKDGYSMESRIKGELEMPVNFRVQYLTDMLKGTNAGSLFGATSLAPWGINESCYEYEPKANRVRLIMPVRTS